MSGGAVTVTHKQLTDFHKQVTRWVHALLPCPEASHTLGWSYRLHIGLITRGLSFSNRIVELWRAVMLFFFFFSPNTCSSCYSKHVIHSALGLWPCFVYYNLALELEACCESNSKGYSFSWANPEQARTSRAARNSPRQLSKSQLGLMERIWPWHTCRDCTWLCTWPSTRTQPYRAKIPITFFFGNPLWLFCKKLALCSTMYSPFRPLSLWSVCSAEECKQVCWAVREFTRLYR